MQQHNLVINRGKRRTLPACSHIGCPEVINNRGLCLAGQILPVAQLDSPTRRRIMINGLAMKADEIYFWMTCLLAQGGYRIDMGICNAANKGFAPMRVGQIICGIFTGSIDRLTQPDRIIKA